MLFSIFCMASRLTLTSRQSLDELHRLTFTEHDRLFHSYPPSQGRAARDGHTAQISVRAKYRRSSKLCRSMNEEGVLNRKQYKLCRRDPGMAHTLVTAYKDMFAQCKQQFQHERWNCLGQASRIKILSKGISVLLFYSY